MVATQQSCAACITPRADDPPTLLGPCCLGSLARDLFLRLLADEAMACPSSKPHHVARRARLQSATRSLLVDLGVHPGDIDLFARYWYRPSAPSALAKTLLILADDHPSLPVHDGVGFALAWMSQPGSNAPDLVKTWAPRTRHGWAYLLAGISVGEYRRLRRGGALPDRETLNGMLALRVSPSLTVRT